MNDKPKLYGFQAPPNRRERKAREQGRRRRAAWLCGQAWNRYLVWREKGA
jgi:hypothetical protein